MAEPACYGTRESFGDIGSEDLKERDHECVVNYRSTSDPPQATLDIHGTRITSYTKGSLQWTSIHEHRARHTQDHLAGSDLETKIERLVIEAPRALVSMANA